MSAERPPEGASVHPMDEVLDGWLDGRLDAEARGELETHLAACERCRRLADGLRAARQALRAGLSPSAPPDGLEVRLRAALDREDVRVGPAVAPTAPVSRRRARLWLAAAAAAVAILAIWSWSSTPGDLVTDAEREFIRLDREGLPADLRTGQSADVERRWQEAALGFPARVFDLAAMGTQLVGGGATSLAGAPAALSAYRGDAGLLLCWMLQARATPLPGGAEIRRHGEFDFHIYRRGKLTLVFWREGDVLCALAGKGDPEAVVSLAFAKAMAPPGSRAV